MKRGVLGVVIRQVSTKTDFINCWEIIGKSENFFKGHEKAMQNYCVRRLKFQIHKY